MIIHYSSWNFKFSNDNIWDILHQVIYFFYLIYLIQQLKTWAVLAAYLDSDAYSGSGYVSNFIIFMILVEQI